ncbi:unnamed protein product, partial [Cyprideis torosa]
APIRSKSARRLFAQTQLGPSSPKLRQAPPPPKFIKAHILSKSARRLFAQTQLGPSSAQTQPGASLPKLS